MVRKWTFSTVAIVLLASCDKEPSAADRVIENSRQRRAEGGTDPRTVSMIDPAQKAAIDASIALEAERKKLARLIQRVKAQELTLEATVGAGAAELQRLRLEQEMQAEATARNEFEDDLNQLAAGFPNAAAEWRAWLLRVESVAFRIALFDHHRGARSAESEGARKEMEVVLDDIPEHPVSKPARHASAG